MYSYIILHNDKFSIIKWIIFALPVLGYIHILLIMTCSNGKAAENREYEDKLKVRTVFLWPEV